jgi:nucleoside-diphosphate-sugar epimerase
MKKIVVTGALGHIGSHFIHTLAPGSYREVVLLDNLATQRYCSLFNLPGSVPFRFVEGDVCTTPLESLFEGADAVVHLAAITDAAGSFEIQDKVERVNLAGTERVARACAATGAALLYLSTTSVYGTQSEVVDEDCPIEDLKPQSPYAESKLRAERLLEILGRGEGLRFISCRFGTIYGTSIGMRFHTAVNKFVWQAVMGHPLTVWRTALDQKRPYLDLNDAGRALGFILHNGLFDGRVYNVLTENATVRQIVDLIRREVPDLQVDFVDTRIMNLLSYTVSCERFRSLGFVFEGGLARGIPDTVRLLRGARRGAAALNG